MGIVVKKPGVCTTVQDLGRIGYMSSGFSSNGVMDRRGASTANILVENDRNAPVLEFMLAGPELRFTTDTFIALCGGDFHPTLDGITIPRNKAIRVHKGSILATRNARSGVFGYLAVAGGGLDVPLVMGSASTNIKCHLGGWKGRPLVLGDYVPFKHTMDFLANLPSHSIQEESYFTPEEDGCIHVRVIPGPQEDMFTDEGLRTFYEQTFTTTSKSDRMGYRLNGPEITTKHGSDIISDGIAFGAVQVPSHGRPIIMLADRQATGGYAKIGTVASVDIPKLVQCPPGTPISFNSVSVQDAQELLKREAKRYHIMATQVRRPATGGDSPRRAARRLTPLLEAQAKKFSNEPNWLISSFTKE